jgi:vancomycin aglycone glucosyltransferase
MRVLLSTIGSRGDVQPLVALAAQLTALGQNVHLCVPPDFREWIESLGMPVTPIGPEVRHRDRALHDGLEVACASGVMVVL